MGWQGVLDRIIIGDAVGLAEYLRCEVDPPRTLELALREDHYGPFRQGGGAGLAVGLVWYFCVPCGVSFADTPEQQARHRDCRGIITVPTYPTSDVTPRGATLELEPHPEWELPGKPAPCRGCEEDEHAI